MPVGHLAINVVDLAKSKAYYDQLMPLLEFEPFLHDADQFAYRPANAKPGTFLFVYPAGVDGDGPTSYEPQRAGLQHLAFMVRTRVAVDQVHEVVQGLGSEIVHAPRDWPEYPPPYYACFWRDPNGLLLEAVCHKRDPEPPDRDS